MHIYENEANKLKEKKYYANDNTRIPSEKEVCKISLHSYILLQAGAHFLRNRENPGEVAYTLVQ